MNRLCFGAQNISGSGQRFWYVHNKQLKKIVSVSCVMSVSLSRTSEWIFMKYDTVLVKINSDKHLHEEVHALLHVFQL
jgi:hypothetical protein